MPETMNENDHSVEETEKKFPSVYFAASRMNHIVAVLGGAFFLLLGCLILRNGNTIAGLLCFAATVAFIGDFLDLVIIGPESIYRTHFFFVSSTIARSDITICSTSKEKNGDQIYLYGFGSHMTMIRSKRLWKKLMEVIGIPEDIREKLDICPGNIYEEKVTPELTVRSQRVMIDYLMHSSNYVSVEIRRAYSGKAHEKTEDLEDIAQIHSSEERTGLFDSWAAARGGKTARFTRVSMIVLVPLLVILGFMGVLYMWMQSKAQDIRIFSFDQTSELVIREVTHNLDRHMYEKTDEHNYELHLMPSEKNKLFKKFIEKSPSYLYSVDHDNSRVLVETGTYVLYYNYRYFTIEMISDIEDSDIVFLCREMACYGILPVMAAYSQDEVAAILPIRADAESPIRVEPTKYSWKDTYGMRCYEDLATFYNRIEPQYYTLKEDEQVILLSCYSNRKWYQDAIEIRVDDQGFEVRVNADLYTH